MTTRLAPRIRAIVTVPAVSPTPSLVRALHTIVLASIASLLVVPIYVLLQLSVIVPLVIMPITAIVTFMIVSVIDWYQHLPEG